MSEGYLDTLKRIKEAESLTERLLSERRTQLEQELKALEEASSKEIAEAQAQGEKLIQSEVEKAVTAAKEEAARIRAEADLKAKELLAKKWDKRKLRKLAEEILFSEFR
jgi:vacuolar-type H+-ATPase subunit H